MELLASQKLSFLIFPVIKGLTKKTGERHSNVFLVNSEDISRIFLMFLLLNCKFELKRLPKMALSYIQIVKFLSPLISVKERF